MFWLPGMSMMAFTDPEALLFVAEQKTSESER